MTNWYSEWSKVDYQQLSSPIYSQPGVSPGMTTGGQPQAVVPTSPPPQKSNRKFFFLGIILVFALSATGGLYLMKDRLSFLPEKPDQSPKPTTAQPVSESQIKFEKFASEEDFRDYLARVSGITESSAIASFGVGAQLERMAVDEVGMAPSGIGGGGLSRVSETTVQVKGIDEPDVVKTDGQEIFFSPQAQYFVPFPQPILMRSQSSRIAGAEAKTKVIRAFPPAELAQDSEVIQGGNLLLSGKILMILSQDGKVLGYDVSDPKAPIKKWQLEYEDNYYLADARLYQGKIFLVTSGPVGLPPKCPIAPMKVQEQAVTIECTDIYHPVISVPVDVTYHAFVLNPENGQIEEKISFVGSATNSVIYMSPDSLYLTYSYFVDTIDFLYGFFQSEGQGWVSDWLIEKLDRLRGYEIGNMAKVMEFTEIYERYLNSLNDDERLKFENEFTNRMKTYTQEHLRELERTGLVKIGLEGFSVLATSDFPGRLLNQFALDEDQGYLRVATTVGSRNIGFGTSVESANDVLVFNEALESVGSVVNLGLGERIYSARFIGNRGYLVTFRQIDPFFVLDLSDPKNPQVKGELKIPGYSSYLHPIDQNHILGVGKEGSQVKLSLFDVANVENPIEVSKYTLDEYWSEILQTHHAFLLDSEHQIFFLPGSKGGYVFSYQNNQLALVKTIAETQVKRAVYINNYLYIIGSNSVVVFNESDWEEVNRLEF